MSLAFDNDYHEKPAVIRQLSKLILMISELDGSKSIAENILILNWDRRFKGIDDALLNAAQIFELTLTEWFWNLSAENRKMIERIFMEADRQFSFG